MTSVEDITLTGRTALVFDQWHPAKEQHARLDHDPHLEHEHGAAEEPQMEFAHCPARKCLGCK